MNKRPSIRSHGFNFVDDLQRLWRKRGTASLPVAFVNSKPEGSEVFLLDKNKVPNTGKINNQEYTFVYVEPLEEK